MDEQTIIYLGVSSIIPFVLLVSASSLGAVGIIVDFLAVITVVIILLLNYADFLIFPAVTKLLKIKIQLSKEHYCPKEQNAIIKYTGGIYYATGYLTANLYNYVFNAESSNTLSEDDQITLAPEKWERIVMNVDFPFKFNVITDAKDVQKYREDLEGERGFLEFQLSRESNSSNPNQMTLTELERKINIIQAKIDKMSSGELPLNTIMYIETTAVGISEKDATDSLTNQLNRLETVFHTFDINILRVVGREIHTLFKLNYILYDPKLTEKLFNHQK
ncbi:MAG: hypothetical protein QXD23_00455 [Candidatus Micrarchaeaceae archaeon]